MNRTPVVSKTGMCGIGYDAEARILEIEFASRKEGQPATLYHYHNVAQEDFDAFMAAESKGSHFIKFIKPKFECVKQMAKKEGVSAA
jgi:KTSC domain